MYETGLVQAAAIDRNLESIMFSAPLQRVGALRSRLEYSVYSP